MNERLKIHVFLGAPPPSSAPASVSADWRRLELTWQDGRLRQATDEDERRSETNADPSTSQRQDEETEPERSLSRDQEPGQGSDQCSSSVHEYLDFCFPADPEPEPAPPHCPVLQPSPAAPPPSIQTQYLSTWTLSQALILRGSRGIQSPPSVSSSTPELFSPLTPSPGASAELFSHTCPTPRAEEGGVVLEVTADGLLCSQEAEQQESTSKDSASKSPDFKRARNSEDLRTEVSNRATATATACLRGPTTPLIQCDKRGLRYSVLVAVVHPCHLKEVKVKSGPTAGTFVPLASIVVTDQSGVEMKVVLWRRAAFWALTVSPGDVLLITGLQVSADRWRGETVLQSTFSSKLLHLRHLSTAPVPQQVDARSLSSLRVFLRERRPLLASSNARPPQDLSRLPYASLRSLRVNTLVHALLRVTHTQMSAAWRGEAESRCRSAVQLQAILTVEQPGGQQGALLLWGAAVDWLPRFRRDRAAVWDFHVLLVREDLTSDLLELHSTPWSSVRPLDASGRMAQDFLRAGCVQTGSSSSSSLELDLDTLLSQKFSGDVELRVQVTAFHFKDSPLSQNASQLVLDSSTPPDGILVVLSGDITYTGCGRCSAELDTDTNGIYRPCYPCLPHTAVRRYYRPGVLTVSGRGHSQVCVQVPPVLLQKILEAPPDKLHRSSAPGSEVKHIQVAAEKIHFLLSLPRKDFVATVRSNFLCDENSVPISQDFTLLDLQFPLCGQSADDERPDALTSLVQ